MVPILQVFLPVSIPCLPCLLAVLFCAGHWFYAVLLCSAKGAHVLHWYLLCMFSNLLGIFPLLSGLQIPEFLSVGVLNQTDTC